jgi:hypothetical protein
VSYDFEVNRCQMIWMLASGSILMSHLSKKIGATAPRAKTPWLIRFVMNLLIAMFILTSPAWIFLMMLEYSFRYGPGRGDYPAVAPDADFQTRRAWGKKEMFDYFKLVDQWVRKSSLIAEDVGKVTGVAPVGSPNRFYAGGFTDGAHCKMNLQVVGEKGEGVLTLPVVNVNNSYRLYGIADSSTWKFGDETDLIKLSGKSWLQEHGFDTLIEQIRSYAEHDEHESVILTCELLRNALRDFVGNDAVQTGSVNSTENGWFTNLPHRYRVEMLRRYAESLSQLGRDEEACKAFRREASLHIEHAEFFRYSSSSRHRDPSELPRSLESARVTIIEASRLRPDDPNVIDLARKRALMAYNRQCGSFRLYYSGEEAAERDAIRRSLGALYKCVVYRAKKSEWLRQQLGSMKFQLLPNNCNNVRINKHGLYEARVVVEIVGRWGKRGILEVSIRENEKKHQPLDLSVPTPRGPLFPFTHRRVRWTPAGGDEIKLAAKTLAPYDT